MNRRVRRSRPRSAALGRDRRPLVVAPCRCAGACRCGGMAHALLRIELERECEFYRSVM